ncbi:MAG: EAL domain-containing protein [Spirochaetia bacterium]|nr:EAL domain-containing protein [Spirochaetia bacterium]
MVKDFQDALQSNQFFIQLQPKFNVNTETIVGAEALVRWNHPTKGLLPPLQFIPILEKHNLIKDLDMFVLAKVCEKLQDWKGHGIPLLPISVNQSRIHLKNPSYVADLLSIVDSYGVDHCLLEFELTENIFLGNLDYLKEVVFSLRKMGFFVSIDDFGSFYSSLNMLKNITVDYLKLDREFLVELENDIPSRKIIRGVIQLANDLGILIVAEGVETKEQVEILKELGCTIAQGFYYERPIAIESYEKLLLEVS